MQDIHAQKIAENDNLIITKLSLRTGFVFRKSSEYMKLNYRFLAVALCCFALLLPAMVNRAPFVYFDSAPYMNNAGKAIQLVQDRLRLGSEIVPVESEQTARLQTSPSGSTGTLAGRSIYYSFLVWISAATFGIGGIAFVQALVLSVLIVICLRIAWPAAQPAPFLVATLAMSSGLSLLTSAGFFVSLVTPDVWVGMMIISFALLLGAGSDLGRGTRLALGVVMACAALFHTSHILVLASMTALSALAMLHVAWRKAMAVRYLWIPALALACGLGGTMAFSVAATVATGESPVGLPFITAHLTDMGPGTRFAQTSCPASGFAICPYADRLPIDWIDFLFSKNPQTGIFAVVPPDVQRAISDEQIRFAIGTLIAEPLATIAGLARDGIAQLWHLSVNDVPLTAKDEAFVVEGFEPQTAETIRTSTIWSRAWLAPTISRVIEIGTAVSFAGLLLLALVERLPRHGAVARVLLICFVGLVLNAVLCGVFASPYGRFQARIAWMLPFLLAISLMVPRFSDYSFPERGRP